MARRAYPLIRRFSVTACCCLIVVLCLVHPVLASPAAGGQGAVSAAAGKEFEDKLKSADGYLKTKDFINIKYTIIYIGKLCYHGLDLIGENQDFMIK